MAFQVSPGINVTETDLTTVVPNVSTSIGATGGQYAWGPVQERTTITTENQLVEVFGKPTASTYNDWVAEWGGYGMTIDVNANNGINSLSFAFEGDPFYWAEYGYYARKFNSITINSAFGETTITRPDK